MRRDFLPLPSVMWPSALLQTSDTTSPYEWSWNTTTPANGSHSFKAYDAAGNVGSSAAARGCEKVET